MAAEIPDELDLRARQKLFIVRSLMERYRDGGAGVLSGIDERSATYLAAANENADPIQIAWAVGYAAAGKDARVLHEAVDWEDAILNAQSEILRTHEETKGG